MKQYIEDFLKTMFVKCLIRGNLTNDELEIMCAHLEDGFKNLSPRRKLKTGQLRDIKLEKGSYKCTNAYNYSRKSSCTLIYYQIKSSLLTSEGIRHSALLRIIQLIIKGYCKEYLRFEKNLGYIVNVQVLQMYDTCGLEISVEGHRFDTTHVENEIDKFMKEALSIVCTIFKSKFNKYKKSAISIGQKNLIKMEMVNDFYGTNDYWQEIVSRNYNFSRREEEFKYMRKAKRKDIRKLFKEMLNKKSQRKFSIHIIHPKNLPTNEEARQNMGNN